jgi:hypothetical protein
MDSKLCYLSAKNNMRIWFICLLLTAIIAASQISSTDGVKPYPLRHHGPGNLKTDLIGKWQHPLSETAYTEYKSNGWAFYHQFDKKDKDIVRAYRYQLVGDGNITVFNFPTTTNTGKIRIFDDLVIYGNNGGWDIHCPPAPCDMKTGRVPPEFWATWNSYLSKLR